MADITSSYMGLKLASPVIVGSSGLTNKLENIKTFEQLGAGAVVLKSLFEEQIRQEALHEVHHNEAIYPEAFDYISNYSKEQHLNRYLDLINQASNAVKMPVIASVNCISGEEWTSFVKRFETAGASAIELNIFVLPSDPYRTSADNEQLYTNIITNVLETVNIPVSVKISYYFSALAKIVTEMSWTGIKGIVMFNRFYSPDIDIEKLKVDTSHVFSTPEEISTSLRWIAMLSKNLQCDVCASTGVHDGTGVVKQMLAGAKAVQVVSTLYKNGFNRILEMNQFVNSWMERKGYEKTSDFIGKLSYKNTENPAAFERVQFMKYLAGIE